ncbi:IS21 family transposase [Thermodesulfobacteriota bacterium]
MKKVYEYDLVRRMFFRESLSKREISRRTGIHRSTIDKMLSYSSPPGYQQNAPRKKTKLWSFIPIIDRILEDDKNAPKKQRHTAKRIFDRLVREYDYDGGYTIVKDYVREKKVRQREVFVPLVQRPGTSQIDFGQAKVVINGVLCRVYFFCMALPYSDALFLKAYPTEGFEAVADGHVSAYDFFCGVPPEHLYDNPSTLIKAVFIDGKRGYTDNFLNLRSHYVFESRFCNVGRPNEKGVVENLVKYTRSNFLVPVPRFPSYDALNENLLKKCFDRLSQKSAGKEKTIGALLKEERPSFLQLPPTPFEACRKELRRVNSLSLVRYKNSNYSVPIEYAYREVTVKAYVFNLKICLKDEVIATHQRSYLRDDSTFDPLHYLPLLQRKPGALIGGAPFSDWALPACFDLLKRYLEGMFGNGGKREYIQVLQLLRDFSITELKRAIEKAFDYSCVRFEAIKMILMSGREPTIEAVRLSDHSLAALPRVRVQSANTGCYAALLQGGAL